MRVQLVATLLHVLTDSIAMICGEHLSAGTAHLFTASFLNCLLMQLFLAMMRVSCRTTVPHIH